MEDDALDVIGDDTWLGRALDMERRTRKIVKMAERSLEETLTLRMESLQQEQQKMADVLDRVRGDLETKDLVQGGGANNSAERASPSAHSVASLRREFEC